MDGIAIIDLFLFLHTETSYLLWSSEITNTCANTNVSCFFVQGPRMVRDVFRLAKENAPAIIFIDEVDAIATARFDAQTGADREVQRILMELLNQVELENIYRSWK